MPVETAKVQSATAVNHEQSIGALFAEYDSAQLALSPESRAYRGIRDSDYGKWDDRSAAADDAFYELLQSTAADMRATYGDAALSDDDRLSYRLFDRIAQRSEAMRPYRDYGYIFNQMFGEQSGLPAFLINIHRVSNAQQAQDYVARIEGLGATLDASTARSAERAAKGIMPPDWGLPLCHLGYRKPARSG